MEAWLTNRQPLIVIPPLSGSTGEFETWLTNRLPLEYAQATGSGAQTAMVNTTDATAVAYAPQADQTQTVNTTDAQATAYPLRQPLALEVDYIVPYDRRRILARP